MIYYQRISQRFVVTHNDFGDNDENISESLNQKLSEFLALNKIKKYQILNVETTHLKSDSSNIHTVLVSMHISYEK